MTRGAAASPGDARRQYVRHTVGVPLEVAHVGESAPAAEVGVNVSHGGLAFLSTWCPGIGEILELRIATVDPAFEARARVMWCRPENGEFLVGVEFLDASDAFRSRMVQQVCAIEQYRQEVRDREGRELTTQQAAAEWIAKFADRFPDAEGRASIAEALRRRRRELEIRTTFPDDVLAEAERVVAERAGGGRGWPDHADRTDIEFVTVDPPGSRDLDQAVHVAREGTGYRLRYAIADVGHWVDRGGAIEREAWLRGLTFYGPDEREPLYPPLLSEGAASLLPGAARPAVLFDLTLDADARVVQSRIERALVRSRAQLTYAQLLAHGTSPAGSPFADEAWAETLALLAELGPKLLAREQARGGVSLPAREQHVQHRAAESLGYHLVYETPNPAEGWNAQVSLLTGHVAAERMLAAGVGLLRTMPPFDPRDVARLRRVALTLGFEWPEGRSYPEFIHGVDPRQPRIDVLVRQARGVMRGADYVAFAGAAPTQPLHGALAFTYAHTTAPLRRLADRYVLDLLVSLENGQAPSDEQATTLRELADVMNAADRKAAQWERWIVDAAEAWTLRDRVGAILAGVVIDVRGDDVEVQVDHPPIRATLALAGAPAPSLGADLPVRVVSADVAAGEVELALEVGRG